MGKRTSLSCLALLTFSLTAYGQAQLGPPVLVDQGPGKVSAGSLRAQLGTPIDQPEVTPCRYAPASLALEAGESSPPAVIQAVAIESSPPPLATPAPAARWEGSP